MSKLDAHVPSSFVLALGGSNTTLGVNYKNQSRRAPSARMSSMYHVRVKSRDPWHWTLVWYCWVLTWSEPLWWMLVPSRTIVFMHISWIFYVFLMIFFSIFVLTLHKNMYEIRKWCVYFGLVRCSSSISILMIYYANKVVPRLEFYCWSFVCGVLMQELE